MTDLLIINPGGGGVIYQSLNDELAAVEPPLWARLIAGYCRDRGHSVEIVDAAANALTPDRVAWCIKQSDPDVVCVAAYGHQPSASTQSMEASSATVTAIKASGYEGPVILVGGHVAALPEDTLRDTDADYVCTVEGPETVERFVASQKYGNVDINVPGLMWRMEGGFGRTEPSTPIADMSQLHGNAWSLLPMERYRAHNWQCFDGSPRSPYASIYTTLGCPYKCSFCCINAPFGGPGYRCREPADVVREVEFLYREYGVTTFKIVDEMFVLKPSHYVPICEGLAALPYADQLNIWAYARIDTVKADKLALLRRAGIRWLALGIESGSAFVRDGSNKTLGQDDIREIVGAIQAAGINVIGNYIFGLPDDNIATMQQTLALAQELNCEFANFYTAMAYPGSALHKSADQKDLPARWSGYSQHSLDTTPLRTATMTSREIVAFRDWAFDQYFTSPRYLQMMHQKFGNGAVDQIKRMTAVKLERDK